jgi:uncharacterized protein (DUF58 family)
LNASPTSEVWTADAAAARASAESAARVLQLPFRGHLWRGRAGAWLGSGRGTSLEFQDHRVYVPGDDPRHINWQAYARTGVYSMKMYREEVSPSVDAVLDVSKSMVLTEEKARRGLELLLFALEAARHHGASVRAWGLAGDDAGVVPVDALLSGDFHLSAQATTAAPELSRVALRSGSLRVLVTDGLFEGAPDAVLARLLTGGGRAVLLMPFALEESDPDWSGPLELRDCESDAWRDQSIEPDVRERYRLAYRRHFAAWQEAARRFGAAVARVPSMLPLVDALREEALAAGAVEPR